MPDSHGRHEEAFREEAELFRLIIESATDYAIFTTGLDGRVLTWNSGAEQILGYAEAEIIGQHVDATFTPKDREERRAEYEMRTALEFGRAENTRWHQKKDGSRFWAEGLVMPLRDAAGEPRGFVKILRDRTEEKRSEERLYASEERCRLMVESLKGFAIFSIGLEGRVSSWNSGAEEVFGYAEAEIVGQDSAVLFTPEDRERGIPEQERKTAERMGEAPDRRWHLRKDGSRFFVDGNLTPLLDDSGTLRGYTKVAHDITQQKLAEEQLKEADRRKDEFLAVLGHELRNPLAAINNAVQLLLPPGREEHLQWSKEVIERQAHQLSRLIEDLLDVSRIAQGKIQLQRQLVDLVPIVSRATEVVRPLVEEKRHELLVLNAPGPIRLDADPSKLEQIIGNLLTNAAKYTDRGGTIRLSTRQEGKDVLITVADSGIGIDPEVLPRVFDLFTQVDEASDRSQGGLGIGLTLVRTLTEMQGGTVSARSDGLGKGSEFTVRLPVATQQAVDKPKPTRIPRASKTGLRILVVDDNQDTALGLTKLLTTAGHGVKTAYDGPSALEVAREERPQVVLADIGLPGMDGFELARELRKEEASKEALLIAISGYGQEEDLRLSREAGFDHHLIKPVDFDSLTALIARRK